VLQRLSTSQYLGILQLTKSDQQNYKGKKNTDKNTDSNSSEAA
jgi:hypothetical protein